MGIKLYGVRVRNYRSIKEVDLKLKNFTVLFGMNDSGKSNFIRALNVAFGNETINETDVYISPIESDPRSKSVIIDLMFIPIDEGGARLKNFQTPWKEHLGRNRMHDNEDLEFFSFRTEFIFNEDTGTYTRSRKVINVWDSESIGSKLNYQTIEKFDFILIDAGRDVSVDVRDRYSVWGKEISSFRIDEQQKESIEKQLKSINEEILNCNSLLRQASNCIYKYATDTRCEVELSPIVKDMNNLYRGMEINILQENGSFIPVENMGLGTRSRASIAIIMAVIHERIKNITPYFCMIAFEEPESNIHPNFQRQLVNKFSTEKMQRIFTTHSPYILSSVDIDSLIYVSFNKSLSEFRCFDNLKLNRGELRRVRQAVLSSKGELMFSNIVILVEGLTELESLPVYIKEYFDREAFEMGITIVAVRGTNYEPFVRILEYAGIECFIFSDGDVKEKVNKMREYLPENNLIIIDNNGNYESHLIESGYGE